MHIAVNISDLGFALPHAQCCRPNQTRGKPVRVRTTAASTFAHGMRPVAMCAESGVNSSGVPMPDD